VDLDSAAPQEEEHPSDYHVQGALSEQKTLQIHQQKYQGKYQHVQTLG
jgi:hypothetical protein